MNDLRSLASLALALVASTAAHAYDPNQKLIALTFDDGPRPYVLYGMNTPGQRPVASLLDLLDKNRAKATFFVMGWRLTPGTYGEGHEPKTAVTCRDAALEVLRRGHEIENHTYSHGELRQLAKRKGEQAAVHDVDRGAAAVASVRGTKPLYLRPPDWGMTREMRQDLQARGYRVLTISADDPVPVRDVNTLDYLCAGSTHPQCPKPSLADSVLHQIEAREKHGVYTHVLAFHELSTTTATLESLLPQLQARGYRFVRLDEYMRQVAH